MLTAITLDHFKSYKAARLPLAPLTVLIGANASGKSNAIEALRLLAWLAQGQKLAAIRYATQRGEQIVRGRLEDLVYCQGEEFSLGCDTSLSTDWNQLRLTFAHREDGLHLVGETLTSPGATVPLYDLNQPSRGRSTDVNVAYNNFKRGGLKPHLICSDQMALFTQLTSSASFNAEHKKASKKIPEIARQYEQWLSAMLFLDPVPARMRDYAFPSEKRLQEDGSNLSGVLFNLWGADDVVKQKPYLEYRADILAFIQSLPEQQIANLTFLTEPRGGVMVQLTETFGDVQRSYDASLLSDGTLRVLAIAAAMLSAESNSLVVIEEIDNGVHPSRARHLLECIQAIAKRRELRVLLSTHHPALLDAVPDAAIPAVVFCYRDPKDGASRLIQLEDVPDYPELIAQGSIGQLMTSGLLERFVKQDHHPEERKARALAWLQRISSGVEP